MSATHAEFAGRHVMVTGAAAGIGRATALAFAAQGARVTAVDLNAEGLAETAAAAEAITPATCDLTDSAALNALCAEAEARHGAIRVLVNNAGVDRRIAFAEQTEADWRWMLAANLDHHALLAAQVAPGMAAAGGGAIVNLSSTAWMKLAGNLTAYHTAKAGILGLTRGLARDLGGQPRELALSKLGRQALFDLHHIDRLGGHPHGPGQRHRLARLQLAEPVRTQKPLQRALGQAVHPKT